MLFAETACYFVLKIAERLPKRVSYGVFFCVFFIVFRKKMLGTYFRCKSLISEKNKKKITDLSFCFFAFRMHI